MKRIYKYAIDPFNPLDSKVVMPLHSIVLKVGCVDRKVLIWAMVDAEQEETEDHYFTW